MRNGRGELIFKHWGKGIETGSKNLPTKSLHYREVGWIWNLDTNSHEQMWLLVLMQCILGAFFYCPGLSASWDHKAVTSPQDRQKAKPWTCEPGSWMLPSSQRDQPITPWNAQMQKGDREWVKNREWPRFKQSLVLPEKWHDLCYTRQVDKTTVEIPELRYKLHLWPFSQCVFCCVLKLQ